jgi:hypothetical protein
MSTRVTPEVLREARRLLEGGLRDPYDAPLLAALHWAVRGDQGAYEAAVVACFRALAVRFHGCMPWVGPSHPPATELARWDFCRGLDARLRLLAEAEALADAGYVRVEDWAETDRGYVAAVERA